MTLIANPLVDLGSRNIDQSFKSSRHARVITRAALICLVLVVLACLAAPLYSVFVAGRGPDQGNIGGSITVNGESVEVVSKSGTTIALDGTVNVRPGGVPIGPQLLNAGGQYVLGADQQGRDVAVRLLYGGRLSLSIAAIAALVCVALSAFLGLVAGYQRGWVDSVISRIFDIVWSFPWILLSLAIGAAFASIAGNFLLIAAMLTYGPIPFYGRAIRSRVLQLRGADFVRAAELSGAKTTRILFTELLPNVAAFLPAMVSLAFANVLLAESTLTYLGVGVQAPTASWGSMIAEGQNAISTAPWVTLFPAFGILITAMALNVIGENSRSLRSTRRKRGAE